MGTSLTGLTPATTYDALIKTGDNAPIDATLKPLSDGVGTNLPMEVSTAGVNFTNQLQQGGVAVPTAAQVAAKQDTLVSGTNIKTINGTSVLGSGNIVTPSTNPSGVAGAIQFSNGSAFASDAANLFWDDTNKRLGVGTNSPTTTLQINGRSTFISVTGSALGSTTANAAAQFYINGQSSILAVSGYFNVGSEMQTYLSSGASVGGAMILQRQSGTINIGGASGSAKVNITGSGSTSSSTSLSVINSAGSAIFTIKDDLTIGIGLTNPTARTHIQGSGSTSATTSLLVQNSAGTERFKIQDDGTTTFNGGLTISTNGGKLNSGLTQMQLGTDAARAVITYSNNTAVVSAKYFTGNIGLIVSDSKTYGDASDIALNVTAVLQADSTTRGFLPPRMTTTQKNAIASPATGLQVFDSTMNATCEYNGTAWRVVSAGAQSIAASTAATTVDMSSGNVQNITLTASTTLTLSSATVGTYIMKLIQGGSGSYTVTWPAAVIWSGGTAPTLTTTVGKVDIITLVFDGTNYYGNYSLNY
jgi:hypothetical protein